MLLQSMDGISVAVLGAGVSGLTAVKCCLDEGLRPVCFERSGYIGGAWHFTTDVSRVGVVEHLETGHVYR